MKNYLFALFSLFFVAANAQEIVMGDMNGDGKVTAQDVTEVVNTVTGKSPLKKISANSLVNPDATESLEIALRSSSGTKISLYSNGKATHNELSEVSAYKYYSNLNRIVLLNSKQDVVDVYDIIIKESGYCVLNEKGTRNFVKFFTSEPVRPKIVLNETEIMLNEGEEFQLTATLTNYEGSTPKFLWGSSDESLATVDQNGLVKIVGEHGGNVWISVSVLNIDMDVDFEACEIFIPGDNPGKIVTSNNVDAKLSFSRNTTEGWWSREDDKLVGAGTGSITITTPADCILSFDYGISTADEHSDGTLHISIDGKEVAKITDGNPDSSISFYLDAGKHEITLNHSGYESCGYIYNMKLEEDYSMEHDYVDLGLSVKWATCNVGANSPEEAGKYYAWGETAAYGEATRPYPSSFTGEKNTNYLNLQNKTDYQFSTYKYSTGGQYNMTKYSTFETWGMVDDKIELDRFDDAASVNWGPNWRMPTEAELWELKNNCYWQWVDNYNGKNVGGYVVYKVKDNVGGKGQLNNSELNASYSISDTHIFLPNAGYYKNTEKTYFGNSGLYWTNSLPNFTSSMAYILETNWYRIEIRPWERCYALPIRPVMP